MNVPPLWGGWNAWKTKRPWGWFFLNRKPLDVLIICLPVFWNKTSCYIENPSFYIENHHVLVNLWSPCFGRMDACLNFIIKNRSCYTPPRRSIQHITKHRNFFIINNQKTLETKVPAYTSPQQSTRFSFPVHFLFIFLRFFNVQRWNFPPTHQQSRFGMSRQEQEDLGEASNNEKDQYPKPHWDWGWLQKNGNVQKGNMQSWNICIFELLEMLGTKKTYSPKDGWMVITMVESQNHLKHIHEICAISACVVFSWGVESWGVEFW